MKFNLSAKNVNLTAELKQKIETKIKKQIKNYTGNDSTWIDVKLIDIFGGPQKEGKDKRCSVTIKLPQKTTIRIEETSDNIEGAIELAKDRIEKALLKYKEKKIDKRRRFSKETIRDFFSRGFKYSMIPAQATGKAFVKIFRRKRK